jgi:hypothetical protein
MAIGDTYIEGPAKGRASNARLQRRGFQGSEVDAQRHNDAIRAHILAYGVTETRWRETPKTYIEPGDTCTYPVLVGSQSVLRTIEIA